MPCIFYLNKAKRFAKQPRSNVINALACVYCYFLRAELKGWRTRRRSHIGELLTAADRCKKPKWEIKLGVCTSCTCLNLRSVWLPRRWTRRTRLRRPERLRRRILCRDPGPLPYGGSSVRRPTSRCTRCSGTESAANGQDQVNHSIISSVDFSHYQGSVWKSVFLQTRNQSLRQLFLTVSWDLHT